MNRIALKVVNAAALTITAAGLSAAGLSAAENPWDKVIGIKNRSELRIYKTGAREPINATFSDADADRIVVVVKNTEMAIQKNDIDRLDARPATKTTRKVTTESTGKTVDPDFTPHPNAPAPVPKDTWSSGIGISGTSKPDFETVYRKPTGPAPKN